LILINADRQALWHWNTLRIAIVVPYEHSDNIAGTNPTKIRACAIFAGWASMSVGQHQLRFAVAAFSSKAAAMEAARELQVVAKPLSNICYLGLQTMLGQVPAGLQMLPFPGHVHVLACSKGFVAKRLAQKLEGGAQTLQDALATWLIPRHAQQLQRAVENGELLVWVQLCDSDDERSAYRILLAAGCTLVGVHDLVRT
jgi:hypothetical protein